MLRSQAFKVVGTASTRVLDSGAGHSGKAGLTASQAEPKTLLSVHLTVDEIIGNVIIGVVGQTEVFQEYDWHYDTNEADGTNQYRSTSKMFNIEINRKLKDGETFYMGLVCGSTATDMYGSYVYDDGT